MCLTSTYICPICETPSGHEDVDACLPGEDCPYKLRVLRLMRARHFPNWHCSNAECGYSREGEEAEHQAVLTAIRNVGDSDGESGHDGKCRPE